MDGGRKEGRKVGLRGGEGSVLGFFLDSIRFGSVFLVEGGRWRVSLGERGGKRRRGCEREKSGRGRGGLVWDDGWLEGYISNKRGGEGGFGFFLMFFHCFFCGKRVWRRVLQYSRYSSSTKKKWR